MEYNNIRVTELKALSKKSFAFYEFVKLFITDRFQIIHFISINFLCFFLYIYKMEYNNMRVP